MKQLGYSKGYQYDHDAEGGVALGQTGFPDAMGERVYYEPVERGLEIKRKEKLDWLRTPRARARADGNGGAGRREEECENVWLWQACVTFNTTKNAQNKT